MVSRASCINNCLNGCMYYASLSPMFKPLHSKTNQELSQKHHCNQSSHCDGATPVNYHLKVKHIHYTVYQLFTQHYKSKSFAHKTSQKTCTGMWAKMITWATMNHVGSYMLLGTQFSYMQSLMLSSQSAQNHHNHALGQSTNPTKYWVFIF